MRLEAVCLDSTCVKVHPDGTGALKKEDLNHSSLTILGSSPEWSIWAWVTRMKSNFPDSNEIISVRVDRTRKQPATTLIRALGIGTDREIIDLFGEDERLLRTLERDTSDSFESGVQEIYKRQKPGEPPTVESARAYLNALFYDPTRYDLAKVGRYKYNKKLGLFGRLAGSVISEDAVDPNTGEIIAEKDTRIDKETARTIENSGLDAIYVYAKKEGSEAKTKVIGNNFVEVSAYIDIDVTLASILSVALRSCLIFVRRTSSFS